MSKPEPAVVRSRNPRQVVQVPQDAPVPSSMRVVDWPLDRLRSAPYSPNVMSPAKLDALVASIKRGGFLEPLVINLRGLDSWNGDGANGPVIVGGHHRRQALARLGRTVAPCVEVDVDEATEAVLNLALNNHGDADPIPLAALLQHLQATATDLTPTGLDPDEIQRLIERMNAAARPPDGFADPEAAQNAQTLVTCPACKYEWAFNRR